MTLDVDQMGLDLGAGIGALLRRFYPVLIRAAYEDAAATLAVEIVFDVGNPLILGLLDSLAEQVRAVAETTRDEIRALVGRQTQEGWSLSQLAAEIRAHGVTQSRRRAALIAQTETAAAYSRGSVAAYRASGLDVGKEWLTADSPCPICDPLDGLVVDLDAEFAPGIAAPPAHPACRCAVAPKVRR